MTIAANTILKQNHAARTPAPTVSHMWSLRFLQRHPEYYIRKQKPLASERAHAHDTSEFQAHFMRFKDAKDKKGILDKDVWNFDETGFRIGVGKAQWVIIKDENGRLFMADPDNRESITAVEAIQSGGEDIPPMIILSGKQHLEKYFVLNDLDPDILIAVSDTGYSNDDLSMEWLYHFDRHSRPKTTGAWRMLVMDGHGSHLYKDFIQYCHDNNIIPFQLPPHTTHLLQPLDIVCFQPLKHYHAEAINNAIRTGDIEFSKLEFLARFQHIRNQAFKKSTILSAFRETGLVPYNPEHIIAKLAVYQEPRRIRSVSPPPDHAKMKEVLFNTPKTIPEIRTQADWLTKHIEKQNPAITFCLEKFTKGSLAKINSGQLAENQLIST